MTTIARLVQRAARVVVHLVEHVAAVLVEVLEVVTLPERRERKRRRPIAAKSGGRSSRTRGGLAGRRRHDCAGGVRLLHQAHDAKLAVTTHAEFLLAGPHRLSNPITLLLRARSRKSHRRGSRTTPARSARWRGGDDRGGPAQSVRGEQRVRPASRPARSDSSDSHRLSRVRRDLRDPRRARADHAPLVPLIFLRQVLHAPELNDVLHLHCKASPR